MNHDRSSDPELLKQIERLKKENEALKVKLSVEPNQAYAFVRQDMSQGNALCFKLESELNAFMQNSPEIPEIEVIAVYLFDEQSNLTLKAHIGLSPDHVRTASIYGSDTALAIAVSNDMFAHAQPTPATGLLGDITGEESIRAISVIPIKDMDDTIGCIIAGSRRFTQMSADVTGGLEILASECAAIVASSESRQGLHTCYDWLGAMFDQVQDFIFIGNEQGALIDFNPAVVQKLGYSPEELKKKKIIELHPPEQREEAQEVVMAMLRGDRSSCVIPLITKAGALTPVETRVSIGRIGDKKYILGISRDLTDTIAAQEALRKSEETYRQMFQVNHAVKLLIDPDTADLTDANQAAAEFYGYPIEKIRGMKLFDINAMEQDSIKGILADAAAGKVKSVSTRHVDSQGLTHDVEVFTSPLSLGDKTLLYAIVIDVTDKKAAERKLQETERTLRETNELLEHRVIERSAELSAINSRLLCEIDDHCRTASSLKDSENNLKVMIDSAPIGITVIQDGKYRYVNEAFIRILGVDVKESAIGRGAGFYGGPNHQKGVLELLASCIQNSEPLNIREFKIKLHDSREINLNIWFQPLELWGKSSIIGFYVDVSEEMQLRAHLNQSQKMEALGALAGGIAHDFNNILFAITGFAELTLDLVKAIPKARSHIQQLLKASDRAADLIKHILTFSREAEQEKRPLWISPILKESLNFLRASIPASIEIKRNIYQDCGIVNADPTQIHQIIMNLVTNAAHAMREKGGVLEVDLQDVELSQDSLMSAPAMPPGLYQKLRISDTGHGIPNDLMSKIFDPYFTTKETGRGTGLGLSVVDGIVRSHKGFIRVESSYGSGSVFEVFLPVISEPAEQEQDQTKVSSHGIGKILLVDDEKIVTTATKANLENLGYNVETDNNPVNALKKFKADPHSFDLVITDMSMPRMNGAEFSQAILRIRHDIPIIMLSGFAELMNKEQALSLGLTDFLLKPVRRAVLAEAVSAAIGKGKS